MVKKLWIAWEVQRRTTSLANELNAKLYQLDYDLPRVLRHPFCIFKTFQILINEKPEFLFVQNPSVFLALTAVLLKKIRLANFRLIVDTHTFTLGKLSWAFVRPLTKLVVKNADVNIVTNKGMKSLVSSFGANALVLPDKIPTLTKKGTFPVKNPAVLFISTFSKDEPIEEIIPVAKLLPLVYFYVTGNFNKISEKKRAKFPQNVIFTGFLSDKDYFNLLYSVDVIMDLTTAENCMVCGAYEALAVGKPLITSSTAVLKSYFNKGTVHVTSRPESIAEGILFALTNKNKLTNEIKELKTQRTKEWQIHWNSLLSTLGDFKSQNLVIGVLPFVSIVIPTYNSEMYLQQCLNSITKLDYPKSSFEIIVVDNLSEDRTVEIAKEFSNVFVNTCIGNIAKSRNIGVSKSKGNIVAFLDSDVVVSKLWLKMAIRHFKDKNVGIVGSFYDFPSKGTWVQKVWHGHYLTKQNASWISSGNMILPKSVFFKVNGFDESLETMEDVDISKRVQQAGYTLVIDNKIKATHLGWPKTICAFFKEELWHSKTMIKEIKKQGVTFDHALLFAFFYLISYICFISGIFINFYFSLTAVGFLLLFTFVLALKTAMTSRRIKYTIPLMFLYMVYGTARALRLLDPRIYFI
jgi:glycosyltransferase involved in cell wall biosynthesis